MRVGGIQFVEFWTNPNLNHLQSCVITAERLANQVRFDKRLSLVGTEVQLEALAQCSRRLPYTCCIARHLGVASHHADEVDDVVCISPES